MSRFISSQISFSCAFFAAKANPCSTLPMIAFDPIYTHPVPQNHRFPMEKYALLYEALLWEGIAEPTDFFTPEPASFEQLILVHSPTYVRQFLSLTLPQREAIRIGFQQSEQLVDRTIP